MIVILSFRFIGTKSRYVISLSFKRLNRFLFFTYEPKYRHYLSVQHKLNVIVSKVTLNADVIKGKVKEEVSFNILKVPHTFLRTSSATVWLRGLRFSRHLTDQVVRLSVYKNSCVDICVKRLSKWDKVSFKCCIVLFHLHHGTMIVRTWTQDPDDKRHIDWLNNRTGDYSFFSHYS